MDADLPRHSWLIKGCTTTVTVLQLLLQPEWYSVVRHGTK
jgi:hypothetical protein